MRLVTGEEAEMIKKANNYVSFSQLEVGKCPYRYKKVYIDKDYKRDSIALRRGKFLHRVIERYVRECVERQVEGDYEILEKIFNDEWEKEKIPEEYYAEIKGKILSIGERDINYNNVLDVEKEFLIEFDDGKYILGYIDIVRVYQMQGGSEPILHIIDYKSQANILSQAETLTSQLRIYTLASLLLYPNFRYFRRGIYYMNYNFMRYYEDDDNPTDINEVRIEVEHTREMLIRAWKKLKESKDYPAITGDWCYQYGGCPVMLDGKCPYMNKEVETIEDKVRKIWEYTSIINDLKKQVRLYIEDNGNIVVDGKEVGFEIKETEKYKIVPIIDICKKANIDISDLEISTANMNKIIKRANNKLEADLILDEIDRYKEVDVKTRFKI